MEVRRRGDGHGIDTFCDQFIEACECAAAGQLGGTGTMLRQRINDPDHRGIRQAAQDTRMIGPHHPCADNADSKRAFRLGFLDGPFETHIINLDLLSAQASRWFS
jgi:hypothetical protein